MINPLKSRYYLDSARTIVQCLVILALFSYSAFAQQRESSESNLVDFTNRISCLIGESQSQLLLKLRRPSSHTIDAEPVFKVLSRQDIVKRYRRVKRKVKGDPRSGIRLKRRVRVVRRWLKEFYPRCMNLQQDPHEPEPVPIPGDSDQGQEPPDSAVPIDENLSELVSHNGINWEFDKAYPIGQFANGDYWVVGPITVISISPEEHDGRNGWQVSPVPFNKQAFDSRIGYTDYDRDLLPALPYTALPGTSLIKVVSRDEKEHLRDRCGPSGSDRSCIETVSVLTVLHSPPAVSGRNSFRPPYAGTQKDLFNVEDLRLDLIPQLRSPERRDVTLDWVEETFRVAQLDHLNVIANQYLYPKGVNSYSADRGTAVAKAMLGILLDDPNDKKLPAIISLVQAGIDGYGILQAGHNWTAQGGHGNARLLPIALAAVLLDHEEMKSLVRFGKDARMFNELELTYIGSDGRALYGTPLLSQGFADYESKYWQRLVKGEGNRLIRDPYGYIDGGDSPGGSYQACCNTMPWKYTALVSHLIPEMSELIDHPALLEYVDRWVEQGALTAPDPCAPHDGEWSNYGITYGPNGQGSCIRDTDPSDGIGRFPDLDGRSKDSGGRGSQFGDTMWDLYR